MSMVSCAETSVNAFGRVADLAEVAVPRGLFADILRLIDGLSLRSPPLPAGSGAMNDDDPTNGVRP